MYKKNFLAQNLKVAFSQEPIVPMSKEAVIFTVWSTTNCDIMWHHWLGRGVKVQSSFVSCASLLLCVFLCCVLFYVVSWDSLNYLLLNGFSRPFIQPYSSVFCVFCESTIMMIAALLLLNSGAGKYWPTVPWCMIMYYCSMVYYKELFQGIW